MTLSSKKIGFWKCWAMSVGIMIGSGIFMLPAVLASYGSISFLGWILTSLGAIFIALVLGRLATRTDRSGGFYVYTQESFGDLAGFLIAWGYWISMIFTITAVSIAFAGYLGGIFPFIAESNWGQTLAAAALIWTLTIVNIVSINSGATLQLISALLKFPPLLVVIVLAIFIGDTENIPPFNPLNDGLIKPIAATALFTMWAFLGLEAATVAAGEVKNPKKTIPRAVIAGTTTVAFLYIATSIAIMMLVPFDRLMVSQAPFIDATSSIHPYGTMLVAFGTLIATAGATNGSIFVAAQMPVSISTDGFAPKIFQHISVRGAPTYSLIFSSGVATLLLAFNLADDLISTFTFLISMATFCSLLPYGVSAIAELKKSWRSSRGWSIIAILALVYSIIAILGSGFSSLGWGTLLLVTGLPVFYWQKNKSEK